MVYASWFMHAIGIGAYIRRQYNILLLKMDQPRPLFYYRSFQTQILHKKLQDSNSDRQSRMQAC